MKHNLISPLNQNIWVLSGLILLLLIWGISTMRSIEFGMPGLPKRLFHGELCLGKRSRSGQRTNTLWRLAYSLKSCGINPSWWETKVLTSSALNGQSINFLLWGPSHQGSNSEKIVGPFSPGISTRHLSSAINVHYIDPSGLRLVWSATSVLRTHLEIVVIFALRSTNE